MVFPDYNGENIVNLMSSIKGFCGVDSDYKNLNFLKRKELEKYNNVVLFLIDALGYKWLEKYAKNSFLYSHLEGKMTTIFPSTTSSVVTTVSTGLLPIEHSIIGWNMYMKETGSIVQVLPWKHSISGVGLGDKIVASDLFVENNFYRDSNKDIYVVNHTDYLFSEYNNFYNTNSKTLAYTNLEEFFSQTSVALHYDNKKYIYSYWGVFDNLCHEFGYDSKEVYNHFLEIDRAFESFYFTNKKNDNLFLVTADHGQISVRDAKYHINIKHSFSDMYNMLAMPLAGEPRFQYCFVKNGMHSNFREYVKKNMSHICHIYSKEEVIAKQIYGLSYPSNKFLERIGDFLLVTKDDYLIYDSVIEYQTGNHGGISDWEMLIPLIVL